MANQTMKWMWDKACAEAQAYYDVHGNLAVPEDYETESGFPLGTWLEEQRQKRRWGRLEQKEERQLDSLHMLWNKYDIRWELSYQAVADYGRLYGDFQIPRGYSTADTGDLFAWLASQRQKYKNGTLSRERAERLEELGVCWKPQVDKWEQMFREAKKYYEIHGNLNVPVNYKTEEGLGLGKWIYDQRKAWREAQEAGKPYDQTRYARLNQIEMCWDGKRRKRTTRNVHAECGSI